MSTEEPVHDTTWQGVRSTTDTWFTGKESISTGWYTAEGLFGFGEEEGSFTREEYRVQTPGS